MTQTRREQVREQTVDAIKTLARQQMAAEGTNALSLRAIARDLGVTAPALYRYFPSRDDLITALLLDGYHGLADALEAEEARYAAADPATQMFHLMMRYRAWAIEHRTDFELMYGNPIPGYEAPRELTVPAATRGFVILTRMIMLALPEGWVPPEHYQQLPPTVQAGVDALHQLWPQASPVMLYLNAVTWARMHGIIMLELFDHIQSVVDDTEAFYAHEVRHLMREMGMKPPTP